MNKKIGYIELVAKEYERIKKRDDEIYELHNWKRTEENFEFYLKEVLERYKLVIMSQEEITDLYMKIEELKKNN